MRSLISRGCLRSFGESSYSFFTTTNANIAQEFIQGFSLVSSISQNRDVIPGIS